jgi:branched-chain amino acid aminotransferase
MMMRAPQYAWLNGEFVLWDKCVLHARSQGAFWGANVFEGVRGYWDADADQLRLFRMHDHLLRLRRSMKCVRMELPFDDQQILENSRELLRRNAFTTDVHLCIVAYFDSGPQFDPLRPTEETGLHLTAVAMPRSPAYERGAAACVSSWRRISDDTMPPRIKTGANYHNSRLAQHEAIRNGYDTALLLNQRGTLAEGPGSCLVMVSGGELVTPPGTSGALEGITVATVEQLAADELGIPLVRREIDRTELYLADEAFMCGTLAEIQPLTSLDRLPIGDGRPAPITRKLQAAYESVARHGRSHLPWSVPVYPSTTSNG